MLERILIQTETALEAVVGASFLAIAALALIVGFARRSHQTFALFLLLACGDFILSAMSRSTLDVADRMAVYFRLAVPFAGLLFGLTYASQRSGFLGGLRSRRYRVAALAILASALAVEALYLIDHGLYVRAVGLEFAPGPLALVDELTYLVIALLAVLFAVDRTRTPPGPSRRANLLIIIGFILYPAFRSAFYLTDLLFGLATRGPDASPALPTLTSGVEIAAVTLTLVVVALVVAVLVRDQRRSTQESRGWATAGVLWSPALATATGVAALLLLATVQTWGRVPLLTARVLGLLWFLTLPVFLGYGLLRFQIYGLDLRVKDAVRFTNFGLVFVLVFAFVLGGGSQFLADVPALVLATVSTTAAAGTAWRPVSRFSRRIADALLPGVHREQGYETLRKFELYQAALDETLAQGYKDPSRDRDLKSLRRRLGVTEKEHHFLLYLAISQRRAARTAPPKDRFRIERELGRGTHGRALLAHDNVLDRRVVLKQAVSGWLNDPSVRDRFLVEARTAARIQHPNVVTLYEVLPEEDPPILVMEHVDGKSLDRILGRRPMDLAKATRITHDVLAGLQAVHEAGLVHRDLKPANIMLTRAGAAKIGDFGVATPTETVDNTRTLAVAEGPAGSPAYMSPEQAAGGRLDARSDLFAVGVILHEMLTGTHYLGETHEPEYRLRRRIQQNAPDVTAAGLPKPMAKLLRQLLAKDPARRPATAAQAARLLEKAAFKVEAAAPWAAAQAAARAPRHA